MATKKTKQLASQDFKRWTDECPLQADSEVRWTCTREVFEPGGYRLSLTFAAPTELTPSPEAIVDQVELVFRDRTVSEVEARLSQALSQMELVHPEGLQTFLNTANDVTSGVGELSIDERRRYQEFDWGHGWAGFVNMWAEPESENDLLKDWMVELRLTRSK